MDSFLKPGATYVWRIAYPLHEIVIHIFTKAHILFCLPWSRYTLVFLPRLAKRMGPGAPPRLTPSLSGPDHDHDGPHRLFYVLSVFCFIKYVIGYSLHLGRMFSLKTNNIQSWNFHPPFFLIRVIVISFFKMKCFIQSHSSINRLFWWPFVYVYFLFEIVSITLIFIWWSDQ